MLYIFSQQNKFHIQGASINNKIINTENAEYLEMHLDQRLNMNKENQTNISKLNTYNKINVSTVKHENNKTITLINSL